MVELPLRRLPKDSTLLMLDSTAAGLLPCMCLFVCGGAQALERGVFV